MKASQGGPAAAAAYLRGSRGLRPAEPSTGQAARWGGPARPGFTNSPLRRQGRRRPALPTCPALTSWTAAADHAEFRRRGELGRGGGRGRWEIPVR